MNESWKDRKTIFSPKTHQFLLRFMILQKHHQEVRVEGWCLRKRMRRREREGEMEMTLSRQLIRFHYDFSFGPERKTLETLTYFFCTNTDKNFDFKWNVYATKYPAQFFRISILTLDFFECLFSAIDWKCLRRKVSWSISKNDSWKFWDCNKLASKETYVVQIPILIPSFVALSYLL